MRKLFEITIIKNDYLITSIEFIKKIKGAVNLNFISYFKNLTKHRHITEVFKIYKKHNLNIKIFKSENIKRLIFKIDYQKITSVKQFKIYYLIKNYST